MKLRDYFRSKVQGLLSTALLPGTTKMLEMPDRELVLMKFTIDEDQMELSEPVFDDDKKDELTIDLSFTSAVCTVVSRKAGAVNNDAAQVIPSGSASISIPGIRVKLLMSEDSVTDITILETGEIAFNAFSRYIGA